MQIVSGQNAFCSQSKEVKHIDGRRKMSRRITRNRMESLQETRRERPTNTGHHRPKVVHVRSCEIMWVIVSMNRRRLWSVGEAELPLDINHCLMCTQGSQFYVWEHKHRLFMTLLYTMNHNDTWWHMSAGKMLLLWRWISISKQMLQIQVWSIMIQYVLCCLVAPSNGLLICRKGAPPRHLSMFGIGTDSSAGCWLLSASIKTILNASNRIQLS